MCGFFFPQYPRAPPLPTIVWLYLCGVGHAGLQMAVFKLALSTVHTHIHGEPTSLTNTHLNIFTGNSVNLMCATFLDTSNHPKHRNPEVPLAYTNLMFCFLCAAKWFQRSFPTHLDSENIHPHMPPLLQKKLA